MDYGRNWPKALGGKNRGKMRMTKKTLAATVKILNERLFSIFQYKPTDRPVCRTSFGMENGPNLCITLKERQRLREDEDEDVSSHWIKFRGK